MFCFLSWTGVIVVTKFIQNWSKFEINLRLCWRISRLSLTHILWVFSCNFLSRGDLFISCLLDRKIIEYFLFDRCLLIVTPHTLLLWFLSSSLWKSRSQTLCSWWLQLTPINQANQRWPKVTSRTCQVDIFSCDRCEKLIRRCFFKHVLVLFGAFWKLYLNVLYIFGSAGQI